VLCEAGFVIVRQDAQRRWYELRPEPLAEIDSWLTPYRWMWDDRLDRLDQHLRTMPDDPDDSTRKVGNPDAPMRSCSPSTAVRPNGCRLCSPRPGVELGTVIEVDAPRVLAFDVGGDEPGDQGRLELVDGTGHGARLILTITGSTG
jgi:hypothetical protein